MLTRSLTGDLSSPKSGLTRGFSLGLKASFPTSPVLRQRSTSLNERNTYPVTGSVKYCKKLLYINQKNATKIEAQRNNQYTTNQTILNTDILVVPYFSFQGGGRLSPFTENYLSTPASEVSIQNHIRNNDIHKC